MISDKYSVQNSGENSGMMVGSNRGIIYVNLQKAVKIPSLISNLVKLLGNACIEEEYSSSEANTQEFKPDDKIEYNGVIVYREIIKEFSAYYLTCDSYLNAYDDSHIRGKSKILKCVHMWYFRLKVISFLTSSLEKPVSLEIAEAESWALRKDLIILIILGLDRIR